VEVLKGIAPIMYTRDGNK
jgi:hypothetical protein